eukprot:258694-Pyramimonas_sp.AAC.1
MTAGGPRGAERGSDVGVPIGSNGRGYSQWGVLIGLQDVTVLLLNSRIVSVVRQLLQGYRVRLCKAGYGPFEVSRISRTPHGHKLC